MEKDTIYRQDAIDAIRREIEIPGQVNGKTLLGFYVNMVKDRLQLLPSAEPEIVRCKDCVKCGFCGDNTNLEVMGFYGFCSRAERRTDE